MEANLMYTKDPRHAYQVLLYEEDRAFAEQVKRDYRDLNPRADVHVVSNVESANEFIRNDDLDVFVISATTPNFETLISEANRDGGHAMLIVSTMGSNRPLLEDLPIKVGYIQKPYTARQLFDTIDYAFMDTNAPTREAQPVGEGTTWDVAWSQPATARAMMVLVGGFLVAIALVALIFIF